MPGAEQVLLLLMEKPASSSSSSASSSSPPPPPPPPPLPAAASAATPPAPGAPSDKGRPEPRKSSKPIMEKRRRARINESLAQLKALLLEALKKESSRHSKLEKADILEMTVRHLRSLQRRPLDAPAVLNADPTVLGKYRAGFSECVNEVTRFLSTCEGVTAEVRTRLLSHLGSCMSQINAMNYPAPPPAPGASFGQALVQIPAAPAVPPTGSVAPCKASGNPAAPRDTPKVYGGFQLVPASDGQFAFLIPNTAFTPHGNAVIPLYASAGIGPGGLLPPTAAVSPGSGAQSLPADSVWRPW